MSHGFKLRFDQMRENNPAKPEPDQDPVSGSDDNTMHPMGHARNLCLVWPDGSRAFYNYAYLVSAQFEPGDDMNMIRLSFSFEGVLLRGYGLEELFMALLDHLPRVIIAIDRRYIPRTADAGSIVVEIEIETEDK